MTKKWKQKQLYHLKYPHYLPWHKAIWVAKPNDKVNIDDRHYRIIKTELSAELGSLPKITVEEISE